MMRIFKGIAIAGLMTLEVITSPAIAAELGTSPTVGPGIVDALHPLNLPAKPPECTNGGIPSCKMTFPPLLLTDDQAKMIKQWHDTLVEFHKSDSVVVFPEFKDLLHPMDVPPASASDCTHGGIPVCKRIVPPALLTNDEVQKVEQWHNQNVDAVKEQLAK